MTPKNAKTTFIKKALETIFKMSRIASNTYNANLEKIRNQETDTK
jgi:hypothetical protein